EELIIIRGDASDWASTGWHLDLLKRYEEALAASEQALELAPNDAQALYSKAVALEGLDRDEESQTVYEQALTAYGQVIRLDASDPQAWFRKGVALSQLGQTEQALASFEKALELDPADAGIMFNRGIALGRLGRLEEALTIYEGVLTLAPKDVEIWRAWRDKAIALVTTLAVRNLLAQAPSQWSKKATELTALYLKHGGNLVLGQALTATISDVRTSLDTPEARRLWLAAWQPGDAIAELQLPLRLLSAAVRYLNSGDPPDRRILLELPVEERAILETELGIEDPS
ncbi:MAG: tetratricopeptide repeat protein, partial [Armatimonadota bacterium]|nr:tetratricopeptide repeat protein [Armatimonadota bacterium]